MSFKLTSTSVYIDIKYIWILIDHHPKKKYDFHWFLKICNYINVHLCVYLWKWVRMHGRTQVHPNYTIHIMNWIFNTLHAFPYHSLICFANWVFVYGCAQVFPNVCTVHCTIYSSFAHWDCFVFFLLTPKTKLSHVLLSTSNGRKCATQPIFGWILNTYWVLDDL